MLEQHVGRARMRRLHPDAVADHLSLPIDHRGLETAATDVDRQKA